MQLVRFIESHESGEPPVDTEYSSDSSSVAEMIAADRAMQLPLDHSVISIGQTSGHKALESAITAPTNVLVTGATGFLGAYVVRELLTQADAQREQQRRELEQFLEHQRRYGGTSASLPPQPRGDIRVVCLVRAASDAEAQARLHKALEESQLGLSVAQLAQIEAVAGSVEQSRFGLSEARYAQLASSIDTVIHSAAWVNSLLPYPRLRDSNVIGTVNILSFCTTHSLKPLHFVSTIGVHGGSAEPEEVPLQENRLPHLNGYSQSKWVAEWLVTRAGTMGVPVTIFRPAMICGDSRTGHLNADDFFNRLLRGFVELRGYIDDAQVVYDVTPVDFVAYAIVRISQQLGSQGKAFQFSNRAQSPSLQALGRAITSFGYTNIEPLSSAQFCARLEQRANADANAHTQAANGTTTRTSALTQLLPYFGGGFNPDHGVIGTTQLCDALLGSARERPPPIDEAFIHRLLAFLAAKNLLPTAQQ